MCVCVCARAHEHTCVYICMSHAHACVHESMCIASMCACVWRSWVNLRCHSLGDIILISGKGSHQFGGAHQFGLVGQSMSSKEHICFHLTIIVLDTLFHHIWLFNLGSKDRTQVLSLCGNRAISPTLSSKVFWT